MSGHANVAVPASGCELPRQVIFSEKSELLLTDSGRINNRKLATWIETTLRGPAAG